MSGHPPLIRVTTRGDIANTRPNPDVAVVVFLDPADAPFLADWLEASCKGGWGAFEYVVMEDTAIPEDSWKKVLNPAWWRLGPGRDVRKALETGPSPEHAKRLVGMFPELAEHTEVVFACTYGKSRSVIAAKAFEAWNNGQPLFLSDSVRQRNPWWAHLLERALLKQKQA